VSRAVKSLPQSKTSPIAVAIAVAALGLAAVFASTTAAAKVPTRKLSAKGATVKFSATVKNAKTCAWKVSPKVAGFDKTVTCKTGTVTRSAKFRANTSTKAKSYSVTLTIQGKSMRIHRWKVDEAGKVRPAPPTSSLPTTTVPATTATDHICGDTSILDGPSTAPADSVIVPTGNDSSVLGSPAADTTFWFAPGTHTLGTGEYDQIDPGQGDTFIGAPGAIVSGQWDNNSAFAGTASGVTIKYLTIENFDPPGDEGAVNHDSGEGWTVEYDTVQDNSPGAGLMVGTNDVVASNCLTDNGEYGFNAYSTNDVSSLTGGPSNIVLMNNEISYNNTCNWEDESPNPVPAADVPTNCTGTSAGQFDGCGCAGGGKFWEVDGATVSNNYVHNNYDVGLWADTDNTGFDVSGNTFATNWSVGYLEEISYNFSITDNTFTDNAWGDGPTNSGFPTGAIYVSESGGDSRVPGAYSGVALISGNTFTNNWSGVVLWENSNRFCSDGSDGACTLVDPSVFTQASCAAHLPTATPAGNPDYFDGCRWKTQNVHVTDNTFSFAQANVPLCQPSANSCGQNGLFSEYGSTAPYKAWVVPENVSNNQNNIFGDNTYSGPWSFVGFVDGENVTWSQWTGGFVDQNGSNDQFNSQDAGSTYN
jgi:Right handed beta helix region